MTTNKNAGNFINQINSDNNRLKLKRKKFRNFSGLHWNEN